MFLTCKMLDKLGLLVVLLLLPGQQQHRRGSGGCGRGLGLGVVNGRKDEMYQTCDGTSGDSCGYNRDSSASGDSICGDDHQDCRHFALQGECHINPGWMHLNCRRSCGQCTQTEILQEADDKDCRDLHESCPQWAGELECYTNPAYMSRACPKSCWLCVNATDLSVNDKLSENDVKRIKLFANTDLGLWQAIPQDDHAHGDIVKKEIQKMGYYVKNLPLDQLGPGTSCNNRYHDCAKWVHTKGCIAELDFMLTHCSLACQQCGIVEDYQKCKHMTRPDPNPTLFGNAKNVFVHLFHELNGSNLLENHLDDSDREDGEWILSLKHNAIWQSDGDENRIVEEIVSTTQELEEEWENATAKDYVDSPSDPIPDRSGKSLVCDSKCQSKYPQIASLQTQIATMLNVDSKYLMPLEFVHYRRGQRFAPHHDYRLHDSWKFSGRRAISVFVALQLPKEGGAFGFPDLNWLLIEKPEVLVWPNIAPSDAKTSLSRMTSEQLPVIEGEFYGVYTWVREYPFDDSSSCS